MVDENNTSHGSTSNKTALVGGAVAIVAIILLLIWVFSSGDSDDQQVTEQPVQQQPEPAPEPEPEPEPAPAPEAQTQEPEEPEEPPEEPLPTLAESDDAVLEDVNEVSAGSTLQQHMTNDNVILKSVRAISALEEGALVNKYRPLTGPESAFEPELVEDEQLEDDEPIRYRMTEETYSRYDQHVNALVQMDVRQLAELYNRFYPLLEQAYEEQGVDKGNFREVTLAAIDNVLQAPIIEEELQLVQPSVMFRYADPDLEALPGAHKLMLRMGPDNARKVKNVLRHLRAELE